MTAIEPDVLRFRVLRLTGDTELADTVQRIALDERQHRWVIDDLRQHIARLESQLPQRNPKPPEVYLPRAPAESDG